MIMRRATILSPLWRRKIASSSSSTINNRIIFPSISTLSSSAVSSSATLINQQQQQPAVSFVSSTVRSRSYHNYNQHQQQHCSSWEYYSALAAAAVSTVLVATTTSSSTTLTTRCDDDDDDNNNNNNNNGSNDETETETEIDPYDNLPEKDEPTNCSICLTYRQGPCRPYWRKVEACTKENEEKIKQEEEEEETKKGNNEEEDEDKPSNDPKCFKYMMPWIDCASRYRNLYNLIEMDMNFTEGVKDLEATSLHFDWSSGMEPNIDWANYKSHLLLANADASSESSESSENNDNNESQAQAQLPQLSSSPDYATATTTATTLWKTFDTILGDPELITVEAKIPATMGGGILECAYALDQNNNVIGFAYGTKPSDAVAVQQQQQQINEGNNNKDEKMDVEMEMVPLGIKLAASRTEYITLAASYTYPSPFGNNDKKDNGVESHLYKSQPLFLNVESKKEQLAPTTTTPKRPEIKTARYNVRKE